MFGGRVVGSFLAAGGHARFAYVAGLEDSSTSREREQGFRAALARRGRPPRPIASLATTMSPARERRPASCSPGPDRPDAVFCANDHTAFAVMETARSEFGLQVGREVSIVGFDDVALAAWPGVRADDLLANRCARWRGAWSR